MWNKVTIVGLGLLGGSLGLAMTKRGLAKQVYGLARREETVQEALEKGAIDKGSTNLDEAVSGSELIILCTNISVIKDYMEKLSSYDLRKTLVTDVGSTKQELVQLAKKLGLQFIGSHPMTGSEQSGLAFAREDLFQDKLCFVTSDFLFNQDFYKKLTDLWTKVGAVVKETDSKTHDKIVASISHLPHVVAATLVNSVPPADMEFAAEGFKDTTRVAAGHPKMWADICTTNKKSLLESIKNFGIDRCWLMQFIVMFF